MKFSSSEIPGRVLDHEALFARLQSGHTLVTGNSRLSRVLTAKYNQWRIEKGDRQWQSPAILSWRLWLDGLWEAASLQGISDMQLAVPGDRQLINMWESTLKNEPLKHNLLHPESLAGQLSETRRLVRDWQLDFKDPAWFADDNENYAAFYLWNKAFEARCEKGGWIPPEDRPGLLCDIIKRTEWSIPAAIDLLGFDEFSPSQANLVCALLENGHEVCTVTIPSRQSATVLWKSKDRKAELLQMARWVRYWYEQEPDSSIAVVVPDLQTKRREVERQLEEILTPGGSLDGQAARPWNISMGTPLSRVPMIETAFDLLKFLDDRVDIQEVGRVLRSPWIRGSSTERNNRALLEKQLRDKYPRQLKPGDVRYRAGEILRRDRRGTELPEDQQLPSAWNSPELHSILNKLARFGGEYKKPRLASAWAEAFDRLLASLGWPFDLDSGCKSGSEQQNEKHWHNDSWQTLQAWRDALHELASLDATSPALRRGAAINQLKKICRDKIFQPRTPAAPIQVLGLYEISGLRFDHLWVVGLHNDNWPPSARPNPFIPGKLQKAAQIPNASPQRELEVARTITQRLMETAPDCVFSYPGQLDGEDVLPSPLLGTVSAVAKDDLPAWSGKTWRSMVTGAERPRLDKLAMPGELKFNTARGGSSILKHQAICPFRAFASNRLGADGLETPADGISPMLHGSLVHSTLENFWKETKAQSALMLLDDASLGQKVRNHVAVVVSEDRGLQQRPAFCAVEAERIYRHVMDYLRLEKAREEFEVTGFEKEVLLEIEGQPVRLFIDRIDSLSSGEEIIIDYKTGKVDPGKWFGQRPEEPQLPLYAISATSPPAAIVFGVIRDDGCEYKGVVRREGLFPGLPPKTSRSGQSIVDAGHEMPATIDNWRQVLHRLMADFLAGEASIDPKGGQKTCDNSYCKLQPLCRVDELLQRQKASTRTAA